MLFFLFDLVVFGVAQRQRVLEKQPTHDPDPQDQRSSKHPQKHTTPTLNKSNVPLFPAPHVRSQARV